MTSYDLSSPWRKNNNLHDHNNISIQEKYSNCDSVCSSGVHCVLEQLYSINEMHPFPFLISSLPGCSVLMHIFFLLLWNSLWNKTTKLNGMQKCHVCNPPFNQNIIETIMLSYWMALLLNCSTDMEISASFPPHPSVGSLFTVNLRFVTASVLDCHAAGNVFQLGVYGTFPTFTLCWESVLSELHWLTRSCWWYPCYTYRINSHIWSIVCIYTYIKHYIIHAWETQKRLSKRKLLIKVP